MISTDTPNRYRLDGRDYLDYGSENDTFVNLLKYIVGEQAYVVITVPQDAIVSITDSSGRLVAPVITSYRDAAGVTVKDIGFDPGYTFDVNPNADFWNLDLLGQFAAQIESSPYYITVHVPERGPVGETHYSQLDNMIDMPFRTNETRRRIMPPPHPADPVQDQGMDIPLEQDESYELIAFGDRAAWTIGDGVQSQAWIASNSPEHQRVSAVVRITGKSPADPMRLAIPERFQAELLDVSGSVPSRVALFGSTADGTASSILVSQFEHELPLPKAVSGMTDDRADSSSSSESSSSAGPPAIGWVPYGRCLAGQCEVWRDGSGDYDTYAMFAFVVDLSPLMEETILPLRDAGRTIAMRFRHGHGLSESGWPLWNSWSRTVRFSLNTLPPVPYDLKMEGLNA